MFHMDSKGKQPRLSSLCVVFLKNVRDVAKSAHNVCARVTVSLCS